MSALPQFYVDMLRAWARNGGTVKIVSKVVQVITIQAPMEEKAVVLQFCEAEGYAIVATGPRALGLNSFDPSTLEVIAEREVQIVDGVCRLRADVECSS